VLEKLAKGNITSNVASSVLQLNSI